MQSLDAEKAVGRSYNVSGAEPLTYNQLIDTVCEALGRRVRKVHMAVAPLVTALSAIEHSPVRLPIKAEQILRLNEDKAFDSHEAIEDFGYRPRSFSEGIRLELQEMGITV